VVKTSRSRAFRVDTRAVEPITCWTAFRGDCKVCSLKLLTASCYDEGTLPSGPVSFSEAVFYLANGTVKKRF